MTQEERIAIEEAISKYITTFYFDGIRLYFYRMIKLYPNMTYGEFDSIKQWAAIHSEEVNSIIQANSDVVELINTKVESEKNEMWSTKEPYMPTMEEVMTYHSLFDES